MQAKLKGCQVGDTLTSLCIDSLAIYLPHLISNLAARGERGSLCSQPFPSSLLTRQVGFGWLVGPGSAV